MKNKVGFALSLLSVAVIFGGIANAMAESLQIEDLMVLQEKGVSNQELLQLMKENGLMSDGLDYPDAVTSGNFPNDYTSGNNPSTVISGNFPNSYTSGEFPNSYISGSADDIQSDPAQLPSPQQ